jgi:hypothetical protein
MREKIERPYAVPPDFLDWAGEREKTGKRWWGAVFVNKMSVLRFLPIILVARLVRRNLFGVGQDWVYPLY